MAARNPRPTAAMRKALQAALTELADVTDLDQWVDETLQAIIGADDYTTRWCVGTRDPHGNTYIFGPYATSDAAFKALDSGHLAASADTRGQVLPLIPSPKIPRTRAGDTSPD